MHKINKTFNTPYHEYKHCNGLKFKILGIKIPQSKGDSEAYVIELENGIVIDALIEEIFQI